MSEMGELEPPTKTIKTTLTPQKKQELPPVAALQPYTEWAAAFQAFYSAGTAPIPPVGSGPQPHPYLWAPQHLMAPYTPPPYAAIMYPHGGMYGHPSIPPGTHPYGPYVLPPGNAADAQGNATPGSAEGDKKSSEGKTKNSLKRSKDSLGSLGMLTGKGSESGKGSMSAGSGSEGTTEGSEGISQNGSDGAHKGAEQGATSGADGSGHEGQPAAVPTLPLAIAGKQAGSPTNLVDYWNRRAPAALANSANKRATLGNIGDAVSNDIWQNERELKKQRRKQSNRESARRSRLRKQAECEELAGKVQSLEAENAMLRSELNRTREQCVRLSAENRSLIEQMQMRGIVLEADEPELDENNMNCSREERRDTGSLQVDRDHFCRDGQAANDMFIAANNGENLVVSVLNG